MVGYGVKQWQNPVFTVITTVITGATFCSELTEMLK